MPLNYQSLSSYTSYGPSYYPGCCIVPTPEARSNLQSAYSKAYYKAPKITTGNTSALRKAFDRNISENDDKLNLSKNVQQSKDIDNSNVNKKVFNTNVHEEKETLGSSINRNRPVLRITIKRTNNADQKKVPDNSVKSIAQKLMEKYTVPEKKKIEEIPHINRLANKCLGNDKTIEKDLNKTLAANKLPRTNSKKENIHNGTLQIPQKSCDIFSQEFRDNQIINDDRIKTLNSYSHANDWSTDERKLKYPDDVKDAIIAAVLNPGIDIESDDEIRRLLDMNEVCVNTDNNIYEISDVETGIINDKRKLSNTEINGIALLDKLKDYVKKRNNNNEERFDSSNNKKKTSLIKMNSDQQKVKIGIHGPVSSNNIKNESESRVNNEIFWQDSSCEKQIKENESKKFQINGENNLLFKSFDKTHNINGSVKSISRKYSIASDIKTEKSFKISAESLSHNPQILNSCEATIEESYKIPREPSITHPENKILSFAMSESVSNINKDNESSFITQENKIDAAIKTDTSLKKTNIKKNVNKAFIAKNKDVTEQKTETNVNSEIKNNLIRNKRPKKIIDITEVKENKIHIHDKNKVLNGVISNNEISDTICKVEKSSAHDNIFKNEVAKNRDKKKYSNKYVIEKEKEKSTNILLEKQSNRLKLSVKNNADSAENKSNIINSEITQTKSIESIEENLSITSIEKNKIDDKTKLSKLDSITIAKSKANANIRNINFSNSKCHIEEIVENSIKFADTINNKTDLELVSSKLNNDEIMSKSLKRRKKSVEIAKLSGIKENDKEHDNAIDAQNCKNVSNKLKAVSEISNIKRKMGKIIELNKYEDEKIVRNVENNKNISDLKACKTNEKKKSSKIQKMIPNENLNPSQFTENKTFNLKTLNDIEFTNNGIQLEKLSKSPSKKVTTAKDKQEFIKEDFNKVIQSDDKHYSTISDDCSIKTKTPVNLLNTSMSGDSAYGSSPSTPIPKEDNLRSTNIKSDKTHNLERFNTDSEDSCHQKSQITTIESDSCETDTEDEDGDDEDTTTDSSETDCEYFGDAEVRCPLQSTPKFKMYKFDDFIFWKVLGKGSFGKVMLAQQVNTENYFAVKCIKKDKVLEDNDVESCLVERKVLSLAAKHPYLCHLFCSFQTPSHLFFVMEYLTGGDLMFHLQNVGRFDEYRTCFYAAEIISGLKFLHNKGIIYRDLKLDNILLDYEGHIRIADFGMCKLQIYFDRYADSFCGTPDYMAPEIIQGAQYNQAVDWWSFGVLIFEMMAGKSPFKGCDEDHLFWLICNEQPIIPRFLTREATNLLKQLLEKDPNKRLGPPFTMHGDIMCHPFFKYIDWTRIENKQMQTPYKPKLRHMLDTQFFERSFTKRVAAITPLDETILKSLDQTHFMDFSYTNPNITD